MKNCGWGRAEKIENEDCGWVEDENRHSQHFKIHQSK